MNYNKIITQLTLSKTGSVEKFSFFPNFIFVL